MLLGMIAKRIAGGAGRGLLGRQGLRRGFVKKPRMNRSAVTTDRAWLAKSPQRGGGLRANAGEARFMDRAYSPRARRIAGRIRGF